jgi:hypothetical protein
MAIAILRQYMEKGDAQLHTVAYDLESLVYVVIYICLVYNGPNQKLHSDLTFANTLFGSRDSNDWGKLAGTKSSYMTSNYDLLQAIAPYFLPLLKLVWALTNIIADEIKHVNEQLNHKHHGLTRGLTSSNTDGDTLPEYYASSEKSYTTIESSGILSNASIATEDDPYSPDSVPNDVDKEPDLRPYEKTPLNHKALREAFVNALKDLQENEPKSLDSDSNAVQAVRVRKRAPAISFITEEERPLKRRKNPPRKSTSGR